MPDRPATDRDAPASPSVTPPANDPDVYVPRFEYRLLCERSAELDLVREGLRQEAASWVEVTAYGDAEHQWQNTETGERRRGSPISAKPDDAGDMPDPAHDEARP